jgi:alpha-glucosidase
VPHVAPRAHTGAPVEGPVFLDLYPAEQPSSFTWYEDAGDGFGDSLATELTLQRTSSGATLDAVRSGGFDPGARQLELRVRRVDQGVDAVRLDGVALPERASAEALSQGGWWYDAADLSVRLRLDDPGSFSLELDYDPTLSEPAPPVDVELRVAVPPGTPVDEPVHVSSDANGWIQQPLAWDPNVPGVAVGTLTVPRGAWYHFKYTRGDWCTVEKYPDCEEALDRYAFGAAGLPREDTIYGWRDWCEACP